MSITSTATCGVRIGVPLTGALGLASGLVLWWKQHFRTIPIDVIVLRTYATTTTGSQTLPITELDVSPPGENKTSVATLMK